ncbi:hypothetical protein EVAR_7650_1 [Eumeta japonica]|uniref:Uncharacterized protein n=1 Tax=Eumeta variegata TaxID=151549 RepID=A0A4C1TJG0_EUMVA|nr:hypothetical protein EVAR_7650_1 [Eumeta japonica]
MKSGQRLTLQPSSKNNRIILNSKQARPTSYCDSRAATEVGRSACIPLGAPAAAGVSRTGRQRIDTYGTRRAGHKNYPEKIEPILKAPNLTNVTALKAFVGMGRQTEILAEHLKEQFTPHPTSDSLETASHPVRVERHVQAFLGAPVPPLSGDYFVSLAETVKTFFRLPKRKALQGNTPDYALSKKLEDGLCPDRRQRLPIRIKPTADHATVQHRQAVRAYHAATPVPPTDNKTGTVWVSQ